MVEPSRAEPYLTYRRRLLVASVPVAAASLFGVILLYFAIVLLSSPAWELGRVAPFVIELAVPFALVAAVRRPLASSPEAALIAGDLVLTAAIVAQLLLPYATTSGTVLALAVKMLAGALFLPWGTRVQALTALVTVAVYWIVLASSGRPVAPEDFAHQAVGPLLAALVSIAGAANADRMRRKLFERDAKLDESEAHLLTLLASMREAEARKGAIFESVPDAIVTIDAAGRILDLNSAAERTFGYPRNAAVGEELARLIIPPELRDRHRRAIAHFAATGQTTILGKRVEMVALRSDGSEFPVELTVTRVKHDGPPMFTGCLRDVSERKAAEEHAREQQLELAHVLRVATMGEMAAELAHELNQPLAAIVSFAKGLAFRIGAGTTPPAQLVEASNQIAAEALRAGEVMRRLRGFVRRSDPQRQPCDVNAVVREAAFLIEPDARRADVAVRLVLAPDLPAVSMDRIQIQQVALNLLRNGLEAIVENGAGDGVDNELLVETSLSSVGVEVTVRDTGVGLPPGAEQKVFAAFYTTKGNGLGLGLSIGKSILQEHGGRLWMTRNPYRGATFGFTLPVPPAAAARRAG